MRSPKYILITGASSGLGAALARAYARRGVVLFLLGRDEARLQACLEKVEALGAKGSIKVLDVTDGPALRAWIEQTDKAYPLDLIIANAGISAGTGKGEEGEEQSKSIFATNLHGVLNTVFPVLPLMKKRRRGQIAIMSSLAGFRGIPGAPSYAASKAAVRVYGEALRVEMAPFGIEVNVICPGFVQTPMTAVNDFHMPFLLSDDKAATIMKRGLEANKARIAFPLPMAFIIWLIAALPVALTDWLFAKLPKKGPSVNA